MKEFRMTQARLIALIATGALVGSIAGSVGMSFADNLATTSSILDNGLTIPYDGVLVLDSQVVNSPAQVLEFALYESPTGGTAQWEERHTVSVNNGKFAVALGQGTKVSSSPANATFDQVVLDAEKLYIGIKVDDGTGSFIELAGRQSIEAAPFAAWAATAADFAVERNLNVGSNAQVDGSLGVTGTLNGSTINASSSISSTGAITAGANINAGANVVFSNAGGEVRGVTSVKGASSLGLYGNASGGGSGDLSIDAAGDVSVTRKVEAAEFDGAYVPRYQTYVSQGRGDGGASIYNDATSFNALMIVGNDSAGGPRKIRMYDDLYVAGKYENLQNTMSTTTKYVRSVAGSINMINANQGFCFLAGNHFVSTSTIANAGCNVLIDAGVWKLDQFVVGAVATCAAYCIRLN
jgi:hypothetical protein